MTYLGKMQGSTGRAYLVILRRCGRVVDFLFDTRHRSVIPDHAFCRCARHHTGYLKQEMKFKIKSNISIFLFIGTGDYCQYLEGKYLINILLTFVTRISTNCIHSTKRGIFISNTQSRNDRNANKHRNFSINTLQRVHFFIFYFLQEPLLFLRKSDARTFLVTPLVKSAYLRAYHSKPNNVYHDEQIRVFLSFFFLLISILA